MCICPGVHKQLYAIIFSCFFLTISLVISSFLGARMLWLYLSYSPAYFYNYTCLCGQVAAEHRKKNNQIWAYPFKSAVPSNVEKHFPLEFWLLMTPSVFDSWNYYYHYHHRIICELEVGKWITEKRRGIFTFECHTFIFTFLVSELGFF